MRVFEQPVNHPLLCRIKTDAKVSHIAPLTIFRRIFHPEIEETDLEIHEAFCCCASIPR